MTAAPDFNWLAIEPDFTPEYVAGLRRLTGAQKLASADMLYRTAIAVTTAGMRRRHPGWPEEQLLREACRRVHLSETAA